MRKHANRSALDDILILPGAPARNSRISPITSGMMSFSYPSMNPPRCGVMTKFGASLSGLSAGNGWV
jgi:hypothetical protein